MSPLHEHTYLEAIRAALERALDADERALILGEDIGAYGGAFKLTEGMLDRYGASRVIDTPIAEGGHDGDGDDGGGDDGGSNGNAPSVPQNAASHDGGCGNR